WKGWAILLRQKQKKLIMLPSETMIWQPEFTDKTLSRKPGAVHGSINRSLTERHDSFLMVFFDNLHIVLLFCWIIFVLDGVLGIPLCS
ncbi:hypothetical protein, partial [Shigella flexneri]|uniref:hypothetical protein n=1 Tax=Shigella flexneri TaxID=623 RepID=UPI00374D85B9